MGLFSTKTTQKIDQTTNPVAPDWFTRAMGDSANRVHEIAGLDPSQFVPGANPLQSQAAAGAAGLGSGETWDAALGSVRDMIAKGPASISGASAADSLSRFFNPYMDEVVSTSLAGFDADADRQRTQLGLGLAGRRAGSGADLATALLGGELGRERAGIEAGLRGQGWTSAAGLADSDAARTQQANLFNASQANNFAGNVSGVLAGIDANQRANLGTMADLGGTIRGIEGEEANAPLSLVDWANRQYAQGPFTSLIGEHTTGTNTSKQSGGLGSQLLQIGGKVAAAYAGASDVRLKRDISRVGTLWNGIGVYLYRYLWSPVWETGVMAQEVLKVKPEAVFRHPSGFLMVDYGKL